MQGKRLLLLFLGLFGSIFMFNFGVCISRLFAGLPTINSTAVYIVGFLGILFVACVTGVAVVGLDYREWWENRKNIREIYIAELDKTFESESAVFKSVWNVIKKQITDL